jgi:hypothetical protein
MFSWKIICVNCGSEAAPRPERAGYPTRSFQKSIRLHSRDGSRAQGAIPHELMAMTGALHSRGVRKRSWRTRRCEAQGMNIDCRTVITRGTIRAKSAFRSNENFRNGAPYETIVRPLPAHSDKWEGMMMEIIDRDMRGDSVDVANYVSLRRASRDTIIKDLKVLGIRSKRRKQHSG